MEREATITNIHQARAIIKEVGEKHQHIVSQELRSLTYYPAALKQERDAQKVLDDMEKKYTLHVANALWVDKYDQIPDYIKNYAW